MSSIVHTFRRFVFLTVYFVRRPSTAPALYRDAVAHAPGAGRSQ